MLVLIMKLNRYWLSIFIMSFIVATVLVYKDYTDNFTCTSEIVIKRDIRHLKGLINYRISPNNGIVNLKGHIKVGEHIEYVLDRMVVFSVTHYGNTSVWKSVNISISRSDTTPNDIIYGLLPEIYLKQSIISDVELKRINYKSITVTKGNMPFLFCKKD